MRNIYDIIAEQKAIIDVNMASYDLDYTISHMANNDYYMQEGIGDSIKNAAAKVIEFIKKVMEKIRELIRRMIGFLGGKKSKITMDEIKNATVGGSGDSENNSDGNNASNNSGSAVYDKNIYKGKSPRDITEEEILKGSLRKVNIIKFVEYGIKEKITNKFLGAVDSVTRNHVENFHASNFANTNNQFMKSIEHTCFKGAGSFKKVKGISMAERISLEIGEPKEPQEINVKDIPFKIILSYIEADIMHGANSPNDRGKGLRKFLNDVDKETNKNLNNLKSKLESARAGGEQIDESNFTNIQKIVTMVSSFINFITTNIFKAYNTLFGIYEQAMMDYAKAYNLKFN